MQAISTFITLLGGFAAIGAAIDFMLSKKTHRRMREALEIAWYRFDDVKWRSIGSQEAAAYVKLQDRLFGSKLLSIHRIMSVVIAVLLIQALAQARNIVNYPLGERDQNPWILLWFDTKYAPQHMWEMFPWWEFGELISSTVAFAVSLTLTRWLAFRISHSRNTSPWMTVAALSLQFILCLTMFWTWTLFANSFMAVGRTALHGGQLTLESLSSGLGYGLINIQMTITSLLHSPLTSQLEFNLPFAACDHYSGVEDVTSYGNCAVSHLGSGIRLLLASIFLLASAFTTILVRLFKTVWARLVESEKPIFTQIFTALGVVYAIYSKYT